MRLCKGLHYFIAVAMGMSVLCYAPAQAGAGDIGFAVQALLPDNQLDRSRSYFYLLMEPSQEQTLVLQVFNRNEEDIEVELEAFTAGSNPNGIIDYSGSQPSDVSLAVDFAQLVTIENPVITVPATGTAIAEFRLRMPDEPFVGDVLGGLVVTRRPGGTEDVAESAVEIGAEGVMGERVTIKNIYAYSVAVHLTESHETVEPRFSLESVATGTLAGYPTLVFDICNPQPLVVSGIEISGAIYPKDGGEAVYALEARTVSMAPNSRMPYKVRLSTEQALAPGAYEAALTLTYKGVAWTFAAPLEVQP